MRTTTIGNGPGDDDGLTEEERLDYKEEMLENDSENIRAVEERCDSEFDGGYEIPDYDIRDYE